MKRACRAYAIGGGHRRNPSGDLVADFEAPEALAFQGALCEKFDLSYTTGSVLSGYLSTVRVIIHMLAVPDRFLTDNSEDVRETSSAAVRIRTDAAIPAGNPDAMSLTATMHPVFCGKSGAVVPPQRACRRADRRMRHCPCR